MPVHSLWQSVVEHVGAPLSGGMRLLLLAFLSSDAFVMRPAFCAALSYGARLWSTST